MMHSRKLIAFGILTLLAGTASAANYGYGSDARYDQARTGRYGDRYSTSGRTHADHHVYQPVNCRPDYGYGYGQRGDYGYRNPYLSQRDRRSGGYGYSNNRYQTYSRHGYGSSYNDRYRNSYGRSNSYRGLRDLFRGRGLSYGR